MEKLPQQNQKEEINISEKIAEYKDYINSLREKYRHLLAYKFTTFNGSAPGSPRDITFVFMPESLADYKSSFSESQRISEEDEVELENIKNLINHHIKDSLSYILSDITPRTLSEWLNKFDKGLNIMSSPDNN